MESLNEFLHSGQVVVGEGLYVKRDWFFNQMLKYCNEHNIPRCHIRIIKDALKELGYDVIVEKDKLTYPLNDCGSHYNSDLPRKLRYSGIFIKGLDLVWP